MLEISGEERLQLGERHAGTQRPVPMHPSAAATCIHLTDGDHDALAQATVEPPERTHAPAAGHGSERSQHLAPLRPPRQTGVGHRHGLRLDHRWGWGRRERPWRDARAHSALRRAPRGCVCDWSPLDRIRLDRASAQVCVLCGARIAAGALEESADRSFWGIAVGYATALGARAVTVRSSKVNPVSSARRTGQVSATRSSLRC